MSAAETTTEQTATGGVAERPSATALRALEERSRGLSLEAQMVECVDLLQLPEIVVDDLVSSVLAIREAEAGGPGGRVALVSSDGSDTSGFFYPARELFVQGDGCSFTCLATEIDFEDTADDRASDPAARADHKASPAIDYAAVTCESRPFPVLGFTQRSEGESAYPILLRALASLIEVTRPRRFDLLDREVYRGLLGPAPCFDLALVLWDDDQTSDPRRPLCELSRDLAEVLKAALGAESRFPPVLNDVVCLRMNNKRFDGRLRYVWRV